MFSPQTSLERLAALVPRPRFPLVTYHGVLAPAAPWRKLIVRTPPEPARDHDTFVDVENPLTLTSRR